MASFGAKYINFAKVKNELKGELPTYEDKVQIGALVRAELSVTLASGEIYGDDVLDDKLEEFVSGSLAVEVTDMVDEVESEIYGSKLSEGELVDNTADEIPYGGLGYFKSLIRKGKKLYKAYYYPKVKATIGNDTAQTKAASLTLNSTPLTFTIYEPDTGNWRYRKTFNSEAEARQYIDEKLNGTTASETITLLPGTAMPLGDVKVSDMMDVSTAKLEDDGNGNIAVTATFHKVEGFKAFNESDPKEQSGYYFPFRLSDSIKGEKMTLKKDGTVKKGKENMPFDPELLIFMEKKENTVIEVAVDGETKAKLTFRNSDFKDSAFSGTSV